MRDLQRWHGRGRGRGSNINGVADRVEDAASSHSGSSFYAEVADIGRRRDRLFVQLRNHPRSRWKVQQMFSAQVRRTAQLLPVSWRCGCGRRHQSRFVEPVQFGWSLNREQRNGEQQAQSEGLHGKGGERSSSPAGRLVPRAFECVEHVVFLRNGPVTPTDTCGLRFDPEPQGRRTKKKTASARGLQEMTWNWNSPSGVVTVSAECSWAQRV